MDKRDVLKIVDYTLFTQTATWNKIPEILDDAMNYETASACIPASYVKQAAEYVDGKLPICTVIGFLDGYSITAVKIFETKDAITNGADEIDMVINIGYLKDKKYDTIENEIRLMRKNIGKEIKVKAAGHISSFEDVEEFICLGADRLGTSRLIKFIKFTDTGASY